VAPLAWFQRFVSFSWCKTFVVFSPRFTDVRKVPETVKYEKGDFLPPIN
jgi:hypothetical protein